ncbi:DNA polymerase III subunit alpha [Candidatus Latescibacterota bacterium]
MENTCGFVHLHNHTMYSLLDGAIRLEELIASAKEWGMGSVAITDHGSMFGAVEFYLNARKADIKPIIGSEIYVAIESMYEKKAVRGNIDGSNHLVLLAETNQGYRNLMKIVSKGYIEGFYYKPRVDKELLKEYSEGIIALSACLKGEVAQLIHQGHPEMAEEAAKEYAGIFGENNFFLELQRHGLPPDEMVNEGILKISRSTGIPLIATNDAHYLKADHSSSHEVLLCISTGKTLDDPNRMKMETDQLYLKSPDEMKELFSDVPEAIENTVRIAERCNIEINTDEFHTVKFDVPTDFEGNSDEYLSHITELGMKKRYGEDAEKYRERMEYELGIIKKMQFSDYFLAIYDCTREAHDQDIPVGTARGSAGGSIVAYAIGITNLDPMQFGLIFERFLNPERVSMPDFDVDYADRDRGKMIEYVKRKYGDDHVCQIITFGTMKAKMVVRDVGRVLGMPYGEVDVIAKLIPSDLGTKLDDALDLVPELRELEKKDEQHRELFRHARILEGLNRHAGTHAAGVIITPEPSTEFFPLYRQNEDITSQYTMEYIEKIGCLKVDFLGLRTLTVIRDAVKIIEKSGEKLDIDKIPLDNREIYDLMGRGETIGIFQFESPGMREYLKKLKPSCIEDLIAMNALYRPGPLGSNMVDDFIERKQGMKQIKYPHPLLEDILKETYGVIVYQEQVLKIAHVMSDFSLGAADELRRAMGKKKVEDMTMKKHKFIEGAKKNSIDEKIAGDVFDLMAHFAGYGFNKSHSAGYAILAYQTAWLKTHHPAAFMAASLTSEMDDTKRVVILINECKRMAINVIQPDVNCSFYEFTVENGNVLYGLGAVKNVGQGAIESIIKAREDGGKFRDLYDFCLRVELKSLNKRMIESLVMAGAMDFTDTDRASLKEGIDLAVEYAQNKQREREMGQTNLFGDSDTDSALATLQPLPNVKPWTEIETLANEKAVLGFWFSGHPLVDYTDEIKIFTTPFSELSSKPDSSPVSVGGIVTSVARKMTKAKNKPYISLIIEDMESSGEVLLFNGAYEDYKDKIEVDSMFIFQGTVSNRDNSDDASVFANSLVPLEHAREQLTKAVNIELSIHDMKESDLELLTKKCEKYPGSLSLWIKLNTASSGKYRIKSNRFKVSADPALLKELRTFLGEEAVWIS